MCYFCYFFQIKHKEIYFFLKIAIFLPRGLIAPSQPHVELNLWPRGQKEEKDRSWGI